MCLLNLFTYSSYYCDSKISDNFPGRLSTIFRFLVTFFAIHKILSIHLIPSTVDSRLEHSGMTPPNISFLKGLSKGLCLMITYSPFRLKVVLCIGFISSKSFSLLQQRNRPSNGKNIFLMAKLLQLYFSHSM